MNALSVLVAIVGAFFLGFAIGYALSYALSGREQKRDAYRYASLTSQHEWALYMLGLADAALLGEDPSEAKRAAEVFIKEWNKADE